MSELTIADLAPRHENCQQYIPEVTRLDEQPARILKVENNFNRVNLDAVGDLQDFFEHMDLNGDQITDIRDYEHNYFLTPESINDPCPEQDEDDPELFYVKCYKAFGGPTIFIEWTVRRNEESERWINIDIEHIRFVYAWWLHGGVIDITERPNSTLHV